MESAHVMDIPNRTQKITRHNLHKKMTRFCPRDKKSLKYTAREKEEKIFCS